jgi:hypothetical protein
MLPFGERQLVGFTEVEVGATGLAATTMVFTATAETQPVEINFTTVL